MLESPGAIEAKIILLDWRLRGPDDRFLKEKEAFFYSLDDVLSEEMGTPFNLADRAEDCFYRSMSSKISADYNKKPH